MRHLALIIVTLVTMIITLAIMIPVSPFLGIYGGCQGAWEQFKEHWKELDAPSPPPIHETRA